MSKPNVMGEVEAMRRADPGQVAKVEAKLASLGGDFEKCGWRELRRGPAGFEVRVPMGKSSLDLPIGDGEALALACGRAVVKVTKARRGSACRVEIVPTQAGVAGVVEERQTRKARRAKVANEDKEKFVQRMMAKSKEKRLAEVDRMLARTEREIGRLEAIRADLRAERERLGVA